MGWAIKDVKWQADHASGGKMSETTNVPELTPIWENGKWAPFPIPLKRCPLCRTHEWLQIQNNGVHDPTIECTNCGISLGNNTVHELVERWNMREAEVD